MINTTGNLAFDEFKEIIYYSDLPASVTLTYDIGEIKVNSIMNHVLIVPIDTDSLYFESSNGTELIVHQDSIFSMQTEGYDPITDTNIFRIDLINGMTMHMSLKDGLNKMYDE